MVQMHMDVERSIHNSYMQIGLVRQNTWALVKFAINMKI